MMKIANPFAMKNNMRITSVNVFNWGKITITVIDVEIELIDEKLSQQFLPSFILFEEQSIHSVHYRYDPYHNDRPHQK